MYNPWTDMLQRIPENQHNKLVVVTASGIEVSIQTVLRAEEKYLVIRGRLGGTTDGGRIFFIPYDQVGYLCINIEMPETQIQAMFGEPQPQASTAPPAAAAVPARPSTAAPAEPAEPETQDTPPVEVPLTPDIAETANAVPKLNSGIRLTLPRKSGLIQRLRARAQTGNAPKTPPKP